MKFDIFPDNKYPAYGIFRTASSSDCRICVLSSSHKLYQLNVEHFSWIKDNINSAKIL